MHLHVLLRFFLVLALMLNGMQPAQAAVQHAPMAMPCHEAGMTMTMTAAHADQHAPLKSGAPDHSALCCQGKACPCAAVLAVPMPVALLTVTSWQLVQDAMLVLSYSSVESPRLLRPPIA